MLEVVEFYFKIVVTFSGQYFKHMTYPRFYFYIPISNIICMCIVNVRRRCRNTNRKRKEREKETDKKEGDTVVSL